MLKNTRITEGARSRGEDRGGGEEGDEEATRRRGETVRQRGGEGLAAAEGDVDLRNYDDNFEFHVATPRSAASVHGVLENKISPSSTLSSKLETLFLLSLSEICIS